MAAASGSESTEATSFSGSASLYPTLPTDEGSGMDYSSTMANLKEAITTLIMKTKDIATETTDKMTTSSTTSATMSTSTASPTASSFANTDTTTTSTLLDLVDPLHDSNRLSVKDLSSSLQHFGYVDYFVFVLMLVICAIIGFYFGFVEKKKKKKRGLEERRGSEALDYLVGGRKMKVFPVSLSLVASFVSGISLLGTSTEIYVYGTQYAFILITLVISGFISWYVFLPVFCNLQLTSTYEYFEMRFDKGVRLLGSVLFTIGTLMWLPIVIYVPALAFNQVTGVNIHIVTPVVCLVCIFYTCVGGLKAVVWTDVIQTVIMIGAIILVVVKGTMDVGGLGVVYERSFKSGRIELPEWTFDPTVRISMFSILVGSTMYFIQVTAGNQVIVQRFLSVPGLKQVKSCLILFTAGIFLLYGLTFYNGLLIYATYHDCDPLTTKLVKAKDQLVPLLVMHSLKVLPGVPGLFVAGVFSAALSSLSTGLNSLAAVILEDYVKPLRKTQLSEKQTGLIMRACVVIIGVYSVASVFLVEKMGTHVMQLSMTLSSISNGPLLGLFLMGLLMPHINGKSATAGCVLSCAFMALICIKANTAKASGALVFAEKSVSIEGCSYLFDSVPGMTNATAAPTERATSFMEYFYHMSFLFYTAAGAIFSVLIGCLSGFLFGFNEPKDMNLSLFSPFIQKRIKPAEYLSVRTEEKTVTNKNKVNKRLSFST